MCDKYIFLLCLTAAYLSRAFVQGEIYYSLDYTDYSRTDSSFEDQESESGSGDLESGSGEENEEDSKTNARHPLEWIELLRNGEIIFADQFDLEDISEFVNDAMSNESLCYMSRGSKVSYEKEPQKVVDSDTTGQKKRSSPITYRDCWKYIGSEYEHPSYAVGLLDNGCTAFLIGPYHAMTSATCVYDTRKKTWQNDLDFWRGRNDSGYLQRMEWERAFIPHSFFEEGNLFFTRLLSTEGSVGNNWAIITFKKSQPSPVWIPFGFCQGKAFGPTKDVIPYGYIPHSSGQSMLYSQCSSSRRFLFCWCYSERPPFHDIGPVLNGGPVLNAYQDHFKYSKDENLPPAFGVTFERRPYRQGYTSSQNALPFDSDIFWSVCFLLRKNGFHAHCQKLYDVPLQKTKELHTYSRVILKDF